MGSGGYRPAQARGRDHPGDSGFGRLPEQRDDIRKRVVERVSFIRPGHETHREEGGGSVNEQTLTVLVVDDDESIRRALQRLLQSNGYRVLTFESAEAFLSSAPVTGEFCLVLDIRLPGISGLELYETLASSGIKVPVIFMTAHDNPQWQEMAEKAGATAYLRKPFGEQSLLSALHHACERTQPSLPIS
ncbi:MAG: response regulator [Deltaproteobacteria bacterium]|nr:response regulator [Deltaproteobacteria bacterium]